MKKQITTSIVLAVLAWAVPVAAQDAAAPVMAQAQAAAPATVAKPVNLADLRHHIYVMEGALARAVDYGAKQLNREILAVMPGVFLLEGEARARGVHLEGYGVFFDVRVPSMRESMVWSLRVMMDQDDTATRTTIANMRKQIEAVSDPATKATMQQAVRQLERQLPGGMARTPNVSPGVILPESNAGVGAAAAAGMATRQPALPPSDSIWAKDPNRAYTEAVTRALVDAMIDYSTPMAIAPEHWLTVAARDDEGRDSLAPQDPLEEVVTWIYRIKGSDLLAYRAGKIDRDEVRKRVQVTQF